MCSKMLGILLIVALRTCDVLAQSFRSEEGPYQTVISNTTSCATGPAWFQANITSYSSKGRSLLRGRVSSTKDLKEIKFRVLMYYLEQKKVKVFDMKNTNCHNTIIKLILNTIGIPFSQQNCKIKAGVYEFNNLNVDAILHTVVQSLWYGAAQLRLEVGLPSVRFLCIDIYYGIEKANKENI